MRKKIITSILTFVLTATMLVGCTGSDGSYVNLTSESSIATDDSFGFNSMDYETSDSETGTEIESTTKEYLDSQKLIYECSIVLETTEFDNTISAIKTLIEKYDGFIESDEVSDESWNWYYESYEKNHGTLSEYIVIRIPTKSYNAFLNDVGENGKVMSKNESVTNITKTYNDTAATIEVLEKEEEMLLVMMEQCNTISDMITVENRLAEVQKNLAVQKSSQSTMDIDIAYSTVSISIDEVMEYTKEEKEITFIERIGDAMKESFDNFISFLENLLILFIFVFPYVLIIVAIVALIIAKRRKKKQKRLAKIGQKVSANVNASEKKPENTDDANAECLTEEMKQIQETKEKVENNN